MRYGEYGRGEASGGGTSTLLSYMGLGQGRLPGRGWRNGAGNADGFGVYATYDRCCISSGEAVGRGDDDGSGEG
jgi:hypothetical protein